MNMKARYSQTILYLLAAMGLLSCGKEETREGMFTEEKIIEVSATVGAMTRSNPFGNEEEQQRFNRGDEIAVSDGSKTVNYKFDGMSWTSSSLNPVTGAADYLVWNAPVTYKAWYPATASAAGFTLPVTQAASLEALTSADYMTAEFVCDGADRIPDNHILNLSLRRWTALVTVKVTKVRDEFASDPNFNIYSISSRHGTIPFQEDADDVVEVFPLQQDANTYSAIVTPGKAKDDGVFILVEIAGTERSVMGIPEAEAGKHYIYNLVIGKTTVKITGVTVADWTDGATTEDRDTETSEYDVWDGVSVAAEFEGKSSYGTKDYPYKIGSGAALALLAQRVNNGESFEGNYFQMTSDIDLGGHSWTPIGVSNPFSGVFDGNCKTIKGLNVRHDVAEGGYRGLFGYVIGSELKDLTIRDARVSAERQAGILFGLNDSKPVVITNCHVTGEVSIVENTDATMGANCFGGLFGRADATVTNCSSEVTVTGNWDVGCMAGDAGESVFINCTASGTIKGLDDGESANMNIGVFSGSGGKRYENCYAQGKAEGKSNVGGFAGAIMGNALVRNCTAHSDVIGHDYYVGGFAGKAFGANNATESMNTRFVDCKAVGTVYSDYHFDVPQDHEPYMQRVGGFVGGASGAKMTRCLADTEVKVEYSGNDPDSPDQAGTFAGILWESMTIESCWFNAAKNILKLDPIGYDTDNSARDITGITK